MLIIQNHWDDIPSFPKANLTCLIGNRRLQYDHMSSLEKEESIKAFSSKCDYIGSSYTYFVNGVENTSDIELHFFKNKPTTKNENNFL